MRLGPGMLEQSELAHDREYADDDRGYAQDMLIARRKLQHVDEIEDDRDDRQDDDHADERVHACTEMPLEHREILQQRDHANHDDDHLHNLLGAGVKRQHVDKIEHEDNDEESDEHADEH